jgi:3-phosphoshikimate 1-carboxyvinyltransferase
VRVPGDPSAAAFHLTVAAVVPGARVTIPGAGLNPTRCAYLDRLRRAGLRVTVDEEEGEGPEPAGTVRATGAPVTLGEIEPAAVAGLIDELPALAVAAAFGHGTVRVRGAGELRVKESDRLAAVAAGLAAIGARARLLDDGWEIEGSGGEPLPGGRVAARGDHRIAMAFLVAGLHTRGGVEVDGGEMIATSDPTFLTNLKTIGEFAA